MLEHRSIMSSASLLTTLLLALSIAASPVEVRNSPITLRIARRLNTSNGTMNILQNDQARVAALKDRSASPGVGTYILNAGYNYVAVIGFGEPPNYCKFDLQKILRLPMDDCLIQTNSLSTLLARTLGLTPKNTCTPAPVTALVNLYRSPTVLVASP